MTVVGPARVETVASLEREVFTVLARSQTGAAARVDMSFDDALTLADDITRQIEQARKAPARR